MTTNNINLIPPESIKFTKLLGEGNNGMNPSYFFFCNIWCLYHFKLTCLFRFLLLFALVQTWKGVMGDVDVTIKKVNATLVSVSLSLSYLN